MATLDTIKEIDPRILRVLKRRALRKTLPMVIIFAVIMLVIHDLWVTLFWGFFFNILWYFTYSDVLYDLLSSKYPYKFPQAQIRSNNFSCDFNDDWDSDTINNPAFRSLSCNTYNDH